MVLHVAKFVLRVCDHVLFNQSGPQIAGRRNDETGVDEGLGMRNVHEVQWAGSGSKSRWIAAQRLSLKSVASLLDALSVVEQFKIRQQHAGAP